MVIIYHKSCYDGWGAAWVALQRFPEATLVPLAYGGTLPDIADGEDVYMVDVCLPRPQMDELSRRVNLRVLDHHKTAQAALEGFPNSVFDMTRSGAMLAWNEFFPDHRPPTLIAYVQDQDLWTWELVESEAVAAYIRSYTRTVENWHYLYEALEYHFWDCIKQGHAIRRSERCRVAEVCEHYRLMNLGGHVVPVVNTSLLFSEIGNYLCEHNPDYPFAGYYFDRDDGQRQWGLRSLGFDVSEIAKIYGGGGHQQAAGFQTSTDFLPVMPDAVQKRT